MRIGLTFLRSLRRSGRRRAFAVVAVALVLVVGSASGLIEDAGLAEVLESLRRIDARWLAVTPGFIDVHRDDDYAVVLEPEMPFKVLQQLYKHPLTDVGLERFPGTGDPPGEVGALARPNVVGFDDVERLVPR